MTEARRSTESDIESVEEALHDKRRAQQAYQQAYDEVAEQDAVDIAGLEAELTELRVADQG